jgi:DNA-binding CsgD family transcriptional regulator
MLGSQMARPPEVDDVTWLTEAAATRSSQVIATELGCAPATVQRAMRRLDIAPRPANRDLRPAELDDRAWLADQYEHASAETIAQLLGCAPATVNRALRRQGITIRSRNDQRHKMPARVYDEAWLRTQYEAGRTPAQIARELGVSTPLVYKSMARLGIELDGPWVRGNSRRLKRPPKRRLEQLWKRHGTIKQVARELDVSVNTAAVWLADVGIFVKEVPVISRSDMERHIAAGRSIREIMRIHHVTDRTVMVELRRHGLVKAHKLRPSP